MWRSRKLIVVNYEATNKLTVIKYFNNTTLYFERKRKKKRIRIRVKYRPMIKPLVVRVVSVLYCKVYFYSMVICRSNKAMRLPPWRVNCFLFSVRYFFFFSQVISLSLQLYSITSDLRERSSLHITHSPPAAAPPISEIVLLIILQHFTS